MGRLTAASLDNYWLLVPYDSKNEADLISDHIFPSPFTKNRDQYIKQVNSLSPLKIWREAGRERGRAWKITIISDWYGFLNGRLTKVPSILSSPPQVKHEFIGLWAGTKLTGSPTPARLLRTVIRHNVICHGDMRAHRAETWPAIVWGKFNCFTVLLSLFFPFWLKH